MSRCEASTIDRAHFMYNRIHDTGGQWIAYNDSDYPESIRQAMDYNAPPLFTVYGDTELLGQPAVAIVGSRDPSQRGLLLAEELAGWCAANERPVISGGAQGIDITAHQSALESGGSTVFFIPEGALAFKGPPWLQDFIDSGKATVVSQSIPDVEWNTSAALTRNKSIAAQAQLLAVIDPGQTGGSLRSGHHALDYARRTLVYAYDKANSGYPKLMRGGAYPILNEERQWDSAYLENHWVQSGHVESGQVDLF